jgi:dienelactone hydrolase
MLPMMKNGIILLLSVTLASHWLSGQSLRADETTGPISLDLTRYLRDEASRLLAGRRREVAAMKSPEQIRARQERLRADFLRSLGDLPERTPLNPRVVGTLEGQGYRVEKVFFESRPDHHVTGLLYLPEAKLPVPAVLVPCGHTANGKAGDTYQRICILLARNGMAAFCYDPIGQGERVQKLDPGGKPAIRQGSTTEHTLAGIGAILVGRQAASYRIWDGLRALDFLASRPEIDSSRLGCTGNSGGGTLTAYLMALDDRIAVAAPSCYITSLERLFATIGPQDAEQNITGQVAFGLDHADYIILRAPRPTLLAVGTRDFFDIQGSWDTFREVKLIYGRLGFGERVDLFESDEEHGFTSPRRVASVRWLRRWLLKIDDAITETESSIATDEQVRCTSTGQVLSDLKGRSVFDLNAEKEEQLRPCRESFSRSSSSSAFRLRVKKRLGIESRKLMPRVAQLEERPDLRRGRLRELLIETEPGIAITALEVIPDWPDGRAPTVVRIGYDRAAELAPGGAVEMLAGEGRRVVLAELRGMRWSDHRVAPNSRQSLLGPDVNEAFLALHLARPLLGQRTLDVLALLEVLRGGTETGSDPGFEIQAAGPAALAALHAAALDERGLIRGITLEHSLISWADVVRKGISRDQLSWVVPGVLESYDLPDLTARLEPLPVAIRSPVDAVGHPVPASELEAAFAPCVRAYGKSPSLVLESSR